MTTRASVDIAVHAALALVGIAGLATSLDAGSCLLAGVGGLAVGTAAALAARSLRLGAFPTIGLALAAYALFGSAFAVPGQALFGVLPTGGSLTSLSVGAVWGWADILTLAAPVDLPEHVAVVPYVAAWLAGLVGTTLAARWLPARPGTAWRAALLLAGPLALYLASILLGTREPFAPELRGVAFAAVVLVWLGWRRRAAEGIAPSARPGSLRRRLIGTAVLAAGAVALGAASGAVLASPSERFVLRERIQPPFEPLDVASPLAAFREYSKLRAEETVFEVTGLEPGERVRLATMDSYDGHVWNVAGARVSSAGSGSFVLVGPRFAEPPLAASAGEKSVSFSIGRYDDVWIPGVGSAASVTLVGRSRSELEALRYNAATGSAVLTTGMREGDVVVVAAVRPQTRLEDHDLVDVPVARVDLGPVTSVPDIVASKAREFAGDARSPIERLRAIETTLTSTGYFSRGTASETAPSRAGHGADRMRDMFTEAAMVGDEEQYASAFALMARSLGYPARVVMGFAPDVRGGDRVVEVAGRDVTAWVEVAFEDVGWIPFFPTPEQTDVPQDQDPRPKTEPQPQVRQPPRSTGDQDGLVSAVEIDDGDPDDDGGLAMPGGLVAVGIAVLLPAALLLGSMLAVGAVKARRARRRRLAAEPHEAIRGAWEELVDRCAELGLVVPPNASRRRIARTLAAQLGQPDAAALEPAAVRADAAVFGDTAVADVVVAAAWQDADDLARAVRASAPRRERILSRFRVSAARASTASATARP